MVERSGLRWKGRCRSVGREGKSVKHTVTIPGTARELRMSKPQ